MIISCNSASSIFKILCSSYSLSEISWICDFKLIFDSMLYLWISTIYEKYESTKRWNSLAVKSISDKSSSCAVRAWRTALVLWKNGSKLDSFSVISRSFDMVKLSISGNSGATEEAFVALACVRTDECIRKM